jgi:hypothetical protein
MGNIGLGELLLIGVIGLFTLGVPAVVIVVLLLRRKPTATK